MSNSTYSYTSDTCSGGASTNGSTAALECYNIVDTNQLVTSIWLSAVGGVAVLLLFCVLRNNRCWREIYHKRATQIPDLMWRPYPFLNRWLLDRCWSFMYPIFATPDWSIFLSSGIDSLMLVRTNILGIQLFGPLTVVCLSVLLPLYRTGGYLESTGSTSSVDSIMLFTLANVGNKDNRLWAAIVMSPCMVLWGLYCVYHHYCSFAAYRLLQALLVDEGMDGGCRTLLCPRPTASWRGALAGLAGLLFPGYMHKCDLRTIQSIKESLNRRSDEEEGAATDGKRHVPSPRYHCSSELIEPFHPYWQLPEEQPASSSGIWKPYGLLLGKSNWQFSKRMLVRDEAAGALIHVATRNYVVLWRDAGAIHLNKHLGGVLERATTGESSASERNPDESHAVDGVPKFRLESLEAELRHLFGDELLAVVPVYDARPVKKLLKKLDELYGAIHKLEHDLCRSGGRCDDHYRFNGVEGVEAVEGQDDGAHGGIECGALAMETASAAKPNSSWRSTRRLGKIEKLRSKLLNKREEKNRLEKEIAVARRRVLDRPVDVACFAVFSSHRAARLAAVGEIGLVASIDMTSSWAPCPDSINFHALTSRKIDQQKALAWTMPFYILLMIFPIGALTGALSNLTVALCSGTPETNPIYWQGYCDSTGQAAGFILTTIVPVSISAFWDTFVMPLCCQQLTQRLRIAASLSGLDIAVTVQLYVFTVFNTFLLGVLGGAAITSIGNALQNGAVADLIGESLPTASNYFLNYTAVHALFTNLFRYFWPHDGTVLFQGLRLLRLAAQPFTERERWIIRSTPSFRSARHYASFLLIFVIGTSYGVISPFSLPLALGFFVTSWMAWKYNAMHFYQPNYESRGEVWLVVYRCYVVTLGVSTFFQVCVIISKRFYWQAGIMGAVDVFLLHIGLLYIRRNVSKYVNALPLQHIPPVKILDPSCVEEIRQLYTPSELRAGAVGWFPEHNKVWEKYGLPF